MNLPSDELFWRRAVVSAGGLIYWTGVFIQGRRIRKRIKRSPNLAPRTPKEKLLWLGWMLVIIVWIFQPAFIGSKTELTWLRVRPECLHPLALVAGIVMTIGGYAATLWCYAIMGNAWRIGINESEKTTLVIAGPYRRIRHPIYAFQAYMLAGAVLLLPTYVSILTLALHVVCAITKARDEEKYLLTVHGSTYRELMQRTWRLLPKPFASATRNSD